MQFQNLTNGKEIIQGIIDFEQGLSLAVKSMQ